LPTIQAAIEAALASVVGGAPQVTASGRTDAGVHAEGQVAHVRVATRLTPQQLVCALNSRLPRDIVMRDAREVSPDFHALRDVVWKRYRYTIVNRAVRSPLQASTSAWVSHPLNTSRMRAVAKLLVGRHDFRGFEGSARRAVRSVRQVRELTIRRQGDRCTIEIVADGFLYNMVRNIVGTLIEVGRGHFDLDRVRRIVASRDRRLAGPTAPAAGLCLVDVIYRSGIFVDDGVRKGSRA